MLSRLKNLFKPNIDDAEQLFLTEHKIHWDVEKGYIIDGVIINELSERLEYCSNRRLKKFDNLEELYHHAMIINEKIDLEIATGQYVARLNNTEENLKQLKTIVQKLNHYYREFKREKK